MKTSLGAAALLAALLGAADAAAHAVLESTSPADGAAVAASPAGVVLQFNEPVQPVAAQVIDGNGKIVAGSASASSVDKELRIALPPGLPEGAYLVSYRVVSADAHPISGSITFAVGTGAAAWHTARPPAQNTSAWSAMIIVNRAIYLGTLMMATGGALYLLLAAGDPQALRRALRRPLAIAMSIAAAAGLLGIGLHGGQILEADSSALFETIAPWRQGMASSQGRAFAATFAGLVCLLAGLLVPARTLSRALLLTGSASVLASFVLGGHATTASPRWLAPCVWLLHAGAAAFWVGSLAPLLVSLRQMPDQAPATLGHFSHLAAPAVGVLIAAGASMAAMQMGGVAALTSTAYGALLFAKIVLVCLLLTLAAINRFLLLPMLAGAPARAYPWFGRTIGLELAIGLMVLALAAALSQQVPPVRLPGAGAAASLVDREAGPELVDAKGRKARVRVEQQNSRDNVLRVSLRDSGGAPLSAAEVRMELSQAKRGVEPLTRKLSMSDAGEYRYTGPAFIVPGEWQIRIYALIGDFEQTEFETTITIGP